MLNVSRRNFLAATAGFGAFTRLAAQPAQRMNVVLILADDLGWADVACNGGDLHETPNIDAFARAGMRFTDAYSASPVCSPTRASIMTGKHPGRLGLTTWLENSTTPERNRKLIAPITASNLPLTETTVAKALRSQGYTTALVGKWHLGTGNYAPEAQGFDVNIGGTHWGAPHTHFYPYRGSRSNGSEYRYVPHLEFGKPGEYLADRLTDEALSVIDRCGGNPFFLQLAHHSVHTPLEAKAPDIARFKEKIKPGLNHQNAVYAAMTWNLDQSVGRVLQHLRQRGLEHNTVVIFASDNGGAVHQNNGQAITSNAPLRSGKGSLYEGGVRIPLIVRWPNVTPAGAVCRHPVVSMDLYSTILDAAGMRGSPELLAGQDGLSLAPLLRDPSARLQRDELFFHYPHYYTTTTPVSAVRAGNWKLLEYFEDQHLELYDLASDPGEKNNLSRSNPGMAADLSARLRQWRQATHCPMPSLNQDYKA
ncbi:MAG: sulfatase [Acidobacteria bacterium]|nr:sulfatase [Acidobacteriota bacterium]